MPSEIVRIDQFGILAAGLRNIRCSLENRQAVFDLIPEETLPPDPAAVDEYNDPAIRRLLQGASRIVEGPKALRLEFGNLLSIAVDADIDVDLFGGLHANWGSAPRLDGSKVFYPLLEITNSPWKAQLPEWRHKDDPEVRHIRMISAECSFDVLGELWWGRWIANNAASFE